MRAYGALRNDAREMNVRAWLYRVAHNRCIDHLRRPVPPAAELFEVSRKPLHDPVEEAQRRDDLRRLVEDVGRLPEQQRSALLMREIDGMTYAELASALDVTVPAVKSLLVRARVGLVEAIEARDADCAEIRSDLLRSYDRGVKASGRARRHMRSCDGCREYRVALRGVRRSFAALTPIGVGPLAFVAKLAGGRRRRPRRGSAVAGGGGAAAGRRGTVTACKVAAVVCTAALAGGAVEVKREIVHHPRKAPATRGQDARRAPPAPAVRSRPCAVRPVARPHRRPARGRPRAGARPRPPPRAPKPRRPSPAAAPRPGRHARRTPHAADPRRQTGGALAPADTTVDPAVDPGGRRRPTPPGPVAPIAGAPAADARARRRRRRRPRRPRRRRAAPWSRRPRTPTRARPPAERLARLGAIDYPEPLAHETLLVRRGRRSGLFTMVAVHSTARGPALGGCRMWTYADSTRRHARRPAAVAGDDVQGRRGRAPAGRRQGRDHAAPGRAGAHARSAARPCCSTSATPSSRSAAPT